MASKWENLADESVVKKTAQALEKNGFTVMLAKDGDDASEKAFSLIPEGAQVMNMTSMTLHALGLDEEILKSGRYDAVKNTLAVMDKKTHDSEMRALGAAPTYAIGSVHAVTEDGHVLIASNTGSQLPAYVYGAQHVIWLVGTHKIVKDIDEAMKRIYEHSLPLESERAKKAYGVSGSNVSKLLIYNEETQKGRVTLIFIPEVLGY